MNEKKIDLCAMPTPNPHAIKFIINIDLIKSGTLTFTKEKNYKQCNLADKLLDIDKLNQVMVGKNFISINKDTDAGWEDVLENASNTIQNTH